MKLPKCLFFLLILNTLFFEGIHLYAQNPSQIDILTTEQGLSFREVITIEQDNNGFMWFATKQGLNRYDGYTFKIYNSDHSNPYFIEEDKITGHTLYESYNNTLWYLANDKLFALDITTDKIVAYNGTHNIKGKVLTLHQTEDGSIWIITDNYQTTQNENSNQYLQKFVNGRFKVVASIDRNNRGFVQLLSDKKGNIWWNTTNGNRKYTNTGEFIATYDLDCYDFYGATMHYVPSFFDSSNQHYYFPKTDGGIRVLEKDNHASKKILDIPDRIFHALEDHQRNIWFAGKQSLYRMSSEGQFTDYSQLLMERIDYSEINDLFIDKNNLLWVATDNGLFKVRIGEHLFRTIFKSEKEGWGNTMRGIFEDTRGTIFALCESADKIMMKRTEGSIDTLYLKTGMRKNIDILSAASFFALNDTKTVAYTVSDELLKIDLKTGNTVSFNNYKPNLRVYGPNPILKLRDDRLLFGYSLSRLVLFNTITETSKTVFKDFETYSDSEQLITFFEQGLEENIVWIGTQNDGLLKVNLDGHVVNSFQMNSEPSISKNNILVIEQDSDGSLWVGTYGGGLEHISEDENSIKSYTKANGLPDNNIVGILTDELDNLWISTYLGLSYFDKKTETFLNYYTEDGLSHNEFNYSSFFRDSKGTYYFGGMNGVNSFKPEQILKKEMPPNLKIIGVSGFNSNSKEEFDIDLSQQPVTAIEISPYNQYFRISWTMPSYFHNEKNKFSTQLEGYEDRWFSQGSNASIRYNQLPAGEYVLKIKGADVRGNETSSILSIPITVDQIFYKRWWFISLIILFLIGVMYAIFKYRLNQLLAMERLRTKISSDLHDDVGSLLSGLAMQTELMEMNASEADKSKLQKIALISRNAISRMRDLVWSIDNRRTTTNDLIERMHELAEEQLLPKDISFHIDSSTIKYGAKKLSPQVKQNLFLIYKETITNILRHSDADHIKIEITNEAKTCLFSIQDNGSVKENYKSTGFGLANMRMRAEAIGGTLQFEMNNGFAVIIRLPFNL